MNPRKSIPTVLLLLAVLAPLAAQSTGVSGSNTINKCESKTYTISILNNSGNPLTNLVVANNISLLTGFTYIPGSTSMAVNGNPPFCSADPTGTSTLTWNIGTLCGSPLTLNNGDTLTITFQLQTDCSAVLGSMNVHFTYDIGGTPSSDDTSFSIQVLPGGVTIKKTPAVIPQEVGQTVTWTLTVENTGLGIIQNVAVTDLLGAGLQYVSSNPSGSNSGQTTTWDSTNVPAFATPMTPGQKVTIDITARVIACENLDNKADVRWGCSPAVTCFDTASDGGTATASVQRLVRSPNAQFTPPDITFTYCDNTINNSLTITNVGDGTAHDFELYVDFSPLTVTASSAPYNAGGYFEIPDIPAGGHYDLTFTLQYTAWCGSGDIAKSLIWQPHYHDDCGNAFYPPVEASSVNSISGRPSLALTKTGAAEIIQIGDMVTYTITSSYSGNLSCGSGSTGLITVVDTIPNGFTVIDADGGVWVPGAGGTGGTVTWTYTPPASLAKTLLLQSPLRPDCETYCHSTFTNTVTAAGTDCCGCALSANAAQTSAIQCEQLATVAKTAVPSPLERCSNIQYTNTYTFAANANVTLSDLVFTEQAEHQQQYVPGTLSVVFDGSDITGCVSVTDTTPGGTLSLDFTGCGATSVNSKVLVISYSMTVGENSAPACSDSSFLSWSSLRFQNAGSSECLGDGTIWEAVPVNVQAPAMSLDVSGLPRIIDKCKTQTVTITLTQTSATANPRDVRLVLSGLNYYVVTPAATVCGGTVSPTACTPAIDGNGDYIWTFNDGFNGVGKTATIQISVQKRCSGTGELRATAYFDDKCHDDATADDTCSVSDSETPALLLSGDLLIEKTPEVYYAATNSIQWKIYVTNRGTGSAYNVWVDDVLGSGLAYDSGHPATVDVMTGVTVTANKNHSGADINGATISISEMAPGARREITFNALLVNCNDLTNDVTANWGCVGLDCQAPIVDHATVKIPAPLLVNTNVVVTPIDACTSPTATVTLRNAGQTTCYNLQVSETLPTGLLYTANSTRWRKNGGAWNGPDAAYNPNPTTSPIAWTKNQIATLSSVDPGDTIEIEFGLTASCPFDRGQVTVTTQYENPCGQVFTNAASDFAVALHTPDLRVTKTRVNNPVGCGEAVTWTITVENQSGYTLPVVWVEDTMDAAYRFSASTGDPVYSGDNGTNSGQLVTWELTNLIHGATATMTLTATTDASPCSPELDNTIRAWWGCGAADGLSTTKPGVDAPDNNLCLTTVSASDVRTETRQPSVATLAVGLSPTDISSCNESTTVTLKLANTNTTDASNLDIVITLPTGLTYNTGSARLYLGVDDTGATVPIADPTIVGNQLRFTDTSSTINNLVNTLEKNGGNDTLVLQFSVKSNCYPTASIGYTIYYYDCCSDTQYTNTGSQQITSLYPNLTVTKTPVNSQIACGAQQTWTITVNNTGTGNAQVVRIEDTPGAWITVDQGASTLGLTDMGGGVWGWEINNLAAGASQAFTLVGTLNSAGNNCTTSLRQNNVRVIWGCGTAGETIDGNPSTTAYDCTYGTWSNAPVATLQMPNLTVSSLTPSATCNSDGTFSGSITVNVANNGNGSTSGTAFVIQASDGKGWTGTYTYSGTIAAGGSASIVIPGSSWSPAWVPSCTTCSPASPYTFSVTVDQGNAVCECNEGDNTANGTTLNVYRPELTVTDIDFSSVTCSNDQISGSVRVRIDNTGCATATNAVVTLSSNCGLTFANRTVTVAAGGNVTTAFPISTGSWNSCTTGTCSYTATVDPSSAICECAGTNHSLTEALPPANRLPDLNAVSASASASCSADGSLNGTIDVTVSNIGPVAVSNDFYIQVNDGRGWSSELRYNADLGGPLPLNPGDANTVTFNWTRAFTATPYTCTFPTITATVDNRGSICECSGGNNQTTTSTNLTTPNLRIVSITPGCSSDNTHTIAVVVENNGCAAISTPFTVQLADNDGHNATQTINSLNAGAQQTLTFANWPADGSPATLDFTATTDTGDAVCELTAGDNTSTVSFTRPNLRITAITPECTADGTYRVRLTVENNGSAANSTDFTIHLADDDGHSSDATFTSLGGTLPLGAGTQQTVTFSPWTVDCAPTTIHFDAALDTLNQVCESTGNDNTISGQLVINDISVTAVTPSAVCGSDGSLSGTITVTVRNNGGQAINGDFHIAVNDGRGWSTELRYNADLGGTLPLAAGASATVNIDWNRNFSATPYTCTFPTITINVDSQNALCECNSANNQATSSYNMPHPNLAVVSVTPSCSADGSHSVAVVVENNGCAAASAVLVRLRDNDGRSAEQIVTTLAAGATTTLTFSSWPTDGDPATLTFTAEVDPDAAVCELTGSGHSVTTNAAPVNLRFVSLTPTCSGDERLTIAVQVENTSPTAISGDFQVRLRDNDGRQVERAFTALGGTLPLSAGATQTLTFSDWVCDGNPTTVTFTVTLDSTSVLCEANSTDNGGSASLDLPDLRFDSVTPAVSCSGDGSLSGTLALTVTNAGSAAVTSDFSIALNDGRGWTRELRFAADLGGTLPLAAGAQATVTVNWDRDFSATPFVCTFPAIAVGLDSRNEICESTAQNNPGTGNHTVSQPNLRLVSITPGCTADGRYTVAVVVENTGCGPASGVVVRLGDNDGHSADQTIATLAAGASTTLTFSDWPADGDPATLTFTAVVDPTAAVCELTGDGKTMVQDFIRPNIHLLGLTPECARDGFVNIAMEIENNGSYDVSTDFQVRLSDNDGRQVEAAFTALGGTLPLTVGTRQTLHFTDWPVDGTPPTVVFHAVDDTTAAICDSNNGDDTADATFILQDPALTAVSPMASCSGGRSIGGTITLTITNRSEAPLNQDFYIRIDDGRGWTAEQRYHADLGGQLPIAAGAAVSITVPWQRDFRRPPFVCDYSVTVQIDSRSDICEATTANNTLTVPYHLPFADLHIREITALCSGDGERELHITLGNNGCDDRRSDFLLNLSDSRGRRRTVSFTALGGKLPFARASEQTIVLPGWSYACEDGTVEYTAAVDSGETCDLGVDNQQTSVSIAPTAPNLWIGDIQWECRPDGVLQFNVVVANNGAGDAGPAVFAVYDGQGAAVQRQTVLLPRGAVQTLSFTVTPRSGEQSMNYRFVLDETRQVCECNGADNEKNTTVRCNPSIDTYRLAIRKFCPPGRPAGGVFPFEIVVENSGENDMTDLVVEDTLPAGFRYVPGSSVCAGVVLADPVGNPLRWVIGDLARGERRLLAFQAVADADVKPGQYCNQAMVRGRIAHGAELIFPAATCCTVVTRDTSGGGDCCLQVEQQLLQPQRPIPAYLSFVEPYFRTDSALFTVYAALNLWRENPPAADTLPHFMQQRLRNYALSTAESFYLDSRLGLTLPDGTLWFALAGAFPQQEKESPQWRPQETDTAVTPAQLGFELLGLQAAVAAEDRAEHRERLQRGLEARLQFLKSQVSSLPHAWEIPADQNGKAVPPEEADRVLKTSKEKATLYDLCALYLGLSGTTDDERAAALRRGLRPALQALDNRGYDARHRREELLFITALLREGNRDQAAAKLSALEERPGDEPLSLPDLALLLHLGRELNTRGVAQWEKQLQERFYLSESGIYAAARPDLAYSMNLESAAPLLLAFQNSTETGREEQAGVLFRLFDEAGLFLKKRHLTGGTPLLDLLPNYSFSQPPSRLVALAGNNPHIASVFAQSTIIYKSPQQPLGDQQTPAQSVEIASPAYETDVARLSGLSSALQFMAGPLQDDPSRAVQENGRALAAVGRKYLEALLDSGAGGGEENRPFVWFDRLALKGSWRQNETLEPLRTAAPDGSAWNFSTATLAHSLLAEHYYLQGKGPRRAEVERIRAEQLRLLQRLFDRPHLPERFAAWVPRAGEIEVSTSPQPAAKVTLARLLTAVADAAPALRTALEKQLSERRSEVQAMGNDDWLLLASAPQLAAYFPEEIRQAREKSGGNNRDTVIAAVAARLAGESTPKEIPAAWWDDQLLLPAADGVETRENHRLLRYEPQQLLLDILALRGNGAPGRENGFRYRRTLDVLGSLLESGWGLQRRSGGRSGFLTLPPSEFQLAAEAQRQHIEPGDLLTFRVRVDNVCPTGQGNGRDLPPLLIKSEFSPNLLYAGTEPKPGLNPLRDFLWRYQGLLRGEVLQFTYRAWLPESAFLQNLSGTIYAGTRQSADEFGLDNQNGRYCEDWQKLGRLPFLPLEELNGEVFIDRNANGRRDPGEEGISGIVLRDSRSRYFHSDAAGKFSLSIGEDREALQIDLPSIPAGYALTTPPMLWLNRTSEPPRFALAPCLEVNGFVYVDANDNGRWDSGEERPAGVRIQAGEKEIVSGAQGRFLLRNLPTAWREALRIGAEQPFHAGDTSRLRLAVEEK